MRLLLLDTPFRPFRRRLHLMPEPVEFGVDLGDALGLASENQLVALAEQRVDLSSALGLDFGCPLGATLAHVAVALPAKRLDLRRAPQLLLPLLEQATFRSHTVD